MMNIIDDYKQLVGKTIAFCHMPQFSSHVTIATTDKEVLIATFEWDYDSEENEIRILGEHQAINIIKNSEYLKQELGLLGIFDLETYRKEKEEQRRKAQELYEKQKVEKELKLLAELKAKYEKDFSI